MRQIGLINPLHDVRGCFEPLLCVAIMEVHKVKAKVTSHQDEGKLSKQR
jgi:hypothetical protein